VNVDARMWECAKMSAAISGLPAEWIYAQWVHESTNVDQNSPFYGQKFKSDLAREANNFGGVTQEEDNGFPQPDGAYYYMKFDSPEEYAMYFGRYLKLYASDGIYDARTMGEYVDALKRGQYFGDSVENYIEGMTDAYNEAFA
jgi:hypothetical protein